ncbi:MAG: hypothetical protein M1119_04940 [Firmicutes bacterium]|nr:hypothetical protein [Bacillota bacterium]
MSKKKEDKKKKKRLHQKRARVKGGNPGNQAVETELLSREPENLGHLSPPWQHFYRTVIDQIK